MDINNPETLERLKKLNSIYVAHPKAKEILNEIEKCHHSKVYAKEPRCMALTGETGSGKTTLIEQYMLQHPPSETAKSTSIPIFKSVIQPNTSITDFIITVLKSLISSVTNIREDDVNDEFLKGRLPTLRKRLYRYILEANVKIVILDEFQHLISSTDDKVLNAIADTIKTLIIEAKVPVILVGTTVANQVFLANKEMTRRISNRITLGPFSISNEQEMKTFRKFLASVDKLLPFNTYSDLATVEMSYRFFAASNGYIDDVMRIIVDAGYLAIEEGSENIKIEHFTNAFESNSGQNHTAIGNPFSSNYSELQGWACIEDARLGKPHNSSSGRNKSNDISDVF